MFKGKCLVVPSILILLCFSESINAKGRNKSCPETVCPEQCKLAFRCSTYYSGPELIWTLTDGICKIFVNGCIRSSEECQRQNDCLSPTIDTTKDVCKQNCASNCDSLPQSPICAWFPIISPPGSFEEESFEFSNKCDLDKWSCRNSRPYVSFNEGPCPEASS